RWPKWRRGPRSSLRDPPPERGGEGRIDEAPELLEARVGARERRRRHPRVLRRVERAAGFHGDGLQPRQARERLLAAVRHVEREREPGPGEGEDPGRRNAPEPLEDGERRRRSLLQQRPQRFRRRDDALELQEPAPAVEPVPAIDA